MIVEENTKTKQREFVVYDAWENGEDAKEKIPLEIFLITYNRKQYLLKTFHYLFNRNSPVRTKYKITILDNCSTDGSSELIEYYTSMYSNITHIRHKKNIGGNANIIEAFKMASEKYFWIICDDDDFSWDSWPEIKSAIEKNFDVIVVQWVNKNSRSSKVLLANEMTFLPTCIYKTSLVTEDVIQNAYYAIYTYLPHMALALKVLNDNDSKIYFTEKPIILQNFAKDTNNGYFRGIKNKPKKQMHYHFYVGLVTVFSLYIKNKKFKRKCINNLWTGRAFSFSVSNFFKENKGYIPNLFDFFAALSIIQKVQFILIFIYYYMFPKIENRRSGIYLNIFKIKLRLYRKQKM